MPTALLSCAYGTQPYYHQYMLLTSSPPSDHNDPFSPPPLHQTTWNLFPIVYFGAIDGSFPLEIIEPLWAALDW